MTVIAASSPLEIESRAGVFMPVAYDFLHREYSASLAVATMREVKGGNEGAYFVPAIGFIVDAAMELTLDDIRNHDLSNQIDARAKRAGEYACAVATFGTINDLFIRSYAGSPSLSNGLTPDNKKLLGDAKYLQSLGKEPIGDMGRLTGGAFRLLQDHNLNIEAPDIIGRSFGLLKIAGCDKPGILDLAYDLGIPYVSRQYLRIKGSGESREVGYSRAGHDLIWQYLAKKGGCPSRKIKVERGDSTTIIQQAWHRTTRILLDGDPSL